MATRTVPFDAGGATELPNDKPVVYRIKTKENRTDYVGVAQRGRVRERIQEHVRDPRITGTKVQIEQKPSIREARATEKRVIARSKPRLNRRG